MHANGKQKGTIQFTVKGGKDTCRVAVAGDFTGWKPREMSRGKDGSFSVTLKIPPGRYQYKYLFDGDWVHDTDVVNTVLNPYGTFNSVLTVT